LASLLNEVRCGFGATGDFAEGIASVSQLAALVKAKSEKEACGEFERECRGYCGA
jgi:hypothetical protein